MVQGKGLTRTPLSLEHAKGGEYWVLSGVEGTLDICGTYTLPDLHRGGELSTNHASPLGGPTEREYSKNDLIAFASVAGRMHAYDASLR